MVLDMKNKPTIKTPIPAASPLPNFAFACIPSLWGSSCLHLSLSRLIAHAQQINNQSSLINWEISSSPDLLKPGPRSPLVFCLPSSVFRLLPIPPIQPILSCRLCSFLFFLFRANSCRFVVHSFLTGFVATSQLCKTNPIPSTPESPQSLTPQAFTTKSCSAGLIKTKPNKANLIPPHNMATDIRNPLSCPEHGRMWGKTHLMMRFARSAKPSSLLRVVRPQLSAGCEDCLAHLETYCSLDAGPAESFAETLYSFDAAAL